MGLVTNLIRQITLTLYKSDLQDRITKITSTKLNLANSIDDVIDAGSELDPGSPEAALLEQRKRRLSDIEKKLDAAIQRYKAQLEAVNVEIQSVERFVNEGAESFRYGR